MPKLEVYSVPRNKTCLGKQCLAVSHRADADIRNMANKATGVFYPGTVLVLPAMQCPVFEVVGMLAGMFRTGYRCPDSRIFWQGQGMSCKGIADLTGDPTTQGECRRTKVRRVRHIDPLGSGASPATLGRGHGLPNRSVGHKTTLGGR